MALLHTAAVFSVSCCCILLLSFAIPSQSHAQTDEKPCLINASFDMYPVYYNGHKRMNPDGTAYPGDAFHYVFKFSGSDTCQDFGPRLIESHGGLTLLSHDVFPYGLQSKNGSNNAGGPLSGIDPKQMPSLRHSIIKTLPKNLTTAHYYKVLDTQTTCTVHAGGTRTCHTDYTLSQTPLLSVREDATMTPRQWDIVSSVSPGGTSRVLRDDIQIHYTHAWDFARVITAPPHLHSAADSHVLEDHSSVDAFDSAVTYLCQNPSKNSGCISGHAVLDTDITHTKCLLEQLQSLGIAHNLDAQDDACIETVHQVSLVVHGYSIVKRHDGNGNPVFVPVLVEKKVDAQIHVLPAAPDVVFEHPPITDIHGYSSKNLDGTYYVDDLPAIHTVPHLAFRTVRNDTITFNVTRTASPLTELFSGTCGNSKYCTITARGQNITETPIPAVTGDRLDVDILRTPDLLGAQNFSYRVQVYNIGRIISDTIHGTSLFFAQYSPLYGVPFPYAILRTAGDTTFEKHHGLAVHYLGSNGTGTGDDGTVHGDRRSLINGHSYTVSAGNPYGTHDLEAALILHGGQDITDIVSSVHDSVLHASNQSKLGKYNHTLVSVNDTALFTGQGYGRLDFVYDGLQDEASKYNISNVTLHNTVLSSDFGGHERKHLMSYTYEYPASYVSSTLNVKSVNSDGTMRNETSIEALLLASYANHTDKTVPLPLHMASHIVSGTQSVPYAEMYLGDMHDVTNTAAGRGAAVSGINLPAVRILPELLGILKAGSNNNNNNNSSNNNNFTSLGERYALSSPVAYRLNITTQKASNVIDYNPYGFDNAINYTINADDSNILKYVRYASLVHVVPPDIFGNIANITVNGVPYDVPCKRQCFVFVEGNATIRASNVWGGTATADVVQHNGGTKAAAATSGQYETVMAYYDGVAPYIILISLLFTAVFTYGRFLRS